MANAKIGSKHEARRIEAERRMLAAAVKILAEQGTDGLTLADVGSAAGYSRGLPAHYFGSKTGLIEAVAKHIVDRFANRLADTVEGEPSLTVLLKSIGAYLDRESKAWESAAALQTVFVESLTEPALQPAVGELTQRSTRRLAASIRGAMSEGAIRADIDAQRHAVMILGLLRSLITMWLIDPRSVPLDQVSEELVASLKRELI